MIIIDCEMNPEYTSPTQMIWIPLLLGMIRNSSWRVSVAAKLGATSKMVNDQLSCHIGRDKSDQSEQNAHECHVASNWK